MASKTSAWKNPEDDTDLKKIFAAIEERKLSKQEFFREFANNSLEDLQVRSLRTLAMNGVSSRRAWALEWLFELILRENPQVLARPAESDSLMYEFQVMLRMFSHVTPGKHNGDTIAMANALIERSQAMTMAWVQRGVQPLAEAGILMLFEAEMEVAVSRPEVPALSAGLAAAIAVLREKTGLSADCRLGLSKSILKWNCARALPVLLAIGVDLEAAVAPEYAAPLYRAIGRSAFYAGDLPSWPLQRLNDEKATCSALATVIYANHEQNTDGGVTNDLEQTLQLLIGHRANPANPAGLSGDALVAALATGSGKAVRQLLAAGADPNLVATPLRSLDEIFWILNALQRPGKVGTIAENSALVELVDLCRHPITEVAKHCKNAPLVATVMRWHPQRMDLPGLLTGTLATRAVDLLVDGQEP